MSRLIVLSNRVKMPNNNPTAGGVAVALHDLLVGNSEIWMGWNGDVVDSDVNNDIGCASNEFSNSKQTALASANLQSASTTITYITTALTTKQYQHFYCGFSNNVLWPLLHERTDLISQAPQDYAGYQVVNRLFARQLKKIIQPNDVIWVHDYHFLSVAYYCRQLGMNNRIGFFLHIPFAPLAFWQHLDKSAELITHLAHYNVLGTQTQQDKANCLAVFQHYLKGSFLKDSHLVDSDLKNSFLKDSPINALYTEHNFATCNGLATVQLILNLNLCATHCIAINAYPIGVDVAKIQQQINNLSSYSAKHTQKENAIKPAAQQIIAVDRIDYSKGLLERFSAYRQFLQQYPAYQKKLKFLQIACPSRLDLPVYRQLYNDVKKAVSNVNQQFLLNECRTNAFKVNDFETNAFKTDDFISNWQAITYSETVLSHEALMTAFWQSDIGWVNSLKDGMNLVAKEYIAAQNPDNPGVLVLSCYAGAAEQMHAAVIIDPHQPKSVIHGLKTALTMPLAQRQTRNQMLLQGLQQHDLHTWQQRFLDDLYYDKRYHTNNQRPAIAQIFDTQE